MHPFEVWLRTHGFEDVLIWEEAEVWTATHPKAFHWSVSIGLIGDTWTIADTWCYPDHAAALAALERWDPREGGEPDGWHRHPDSGRRRPATQKELEYVEA